MTGRHFKKRKYDSQYDDQYSSSSESSSEHENDERTVLEANIAKNHDTDKESDKSHETKDIHSEETSGSEEESDTEGSSSDDEGITQLHRPVFVRKVNKKENDTENKNRQDTTEIDIKKRKNLMDRVNYENRFLAAQEEACRQIDLNYSTDKDLLRRAMLLDDNDSVDPEIEKQKWVKRQGFREKARREKLIARQLELEEYEANKLKSDKILDNKLLKEPGERKSNVNGNLNARRDNKFKPSRVKDVSLLETVTMRSAEESEYSIL